MSATTPSLRSISPTTGREGAISTAEIKARIAAMFDYTDDSHQPPTRTHLPET